MDNYNDEDEYNSEDSEDSRYSGYSEEEILHDKLQDAVYGKKNNIIMNILKNNPTFLDKSYDGNMDNVAINTIALGICVSIPDLIPFMIKLGFDIEKKNALHHACSRPNLYLPSIKKLLRLGANPNTKNKNGSTPIFSTTFSNDFESTKILIHYGAKVNISNDKGITPLHYACFRNRFLGDVELVKLLINNGAYINAIDNKGDTPLHYACSTINIDVVKYLIIIKGTKFIKNNNGKLPFDYLGNASKIIIEQYLKNYNTIILLHNNYKKRRGSKKRGSVGIQSEIIRDMYDYL